MRTEQVPLAEQPAPSLADQISMVRGIIEYFEGRDDARLPASALRAVLATLQQHERLQADLDAPTAQERRAKYSLCKSAG